MTAWQRRIRRLRLWLQALFATAVIALALLVGLVRIALPWIVAHPQRISTFLSERMNRPVSIERVEGRSERDGPLLILHGIHIASAKPGESGSRIPRAELKINFFAFLHRNESWNEFRLDGLDLHLVHSAAAGWHLQGLDTGNSAGNKFGPDSPLFDLGSLVLHDLRLRIDAPDSDRHLILDVPEARLINNGGEHRVLARVRCTQSPPSQLALVVRYNSDTRSGEAYIGGNQVQLASILHGSGIAGMQLERGSGQVQLWSWWQRDRLIRARAEVDVRDVVLGTSKAIRLDGKRDITPRVGFDRIAFGARWQRDAGGWQSDVTDLALARQGNRPQASSLHLDMRKSFANADPVYRLILDRIDIASPLSVLMFDDTLPAGWRRWIYMANPQGTLTRLNLRYAGVDDYDVSARVDGVAWHALDDIPGSSGISADILGDQQAISVHLPNHSAFGVDLPHVFRQPLEFSDFSGDLVAYHTQASAWRLETDGIDFNGAGYEGHLRGAIQIPDDGSRPFLDAAAVVTQGKVTASHLFWPINVMPPAAVSWLDRALTSGDVSGRVVIRGDLADWPFHNHAGRFEARADVSNMRLVYLPDWPAAERVDCHADFVNTSLHASVGAAQAGGNRISKATADIADLGEPVLELTASGQGSGKQLLDFLKATPIGLEHAGQLLGVSVGGSGKVDFKLHLPIKHVEQRKLNGSVLLSKADLVDAQYGLRLNDAKGRVQFDGAGFGTDVLPVTVDDHPGTFRMAVGDFSADARHAVEASLQAELPGAYLINYASVLQSYADSVDGTARWDIDFSADRGDVKDSGQRITVKSDLRGVAVELPAPLAKPAADALPLSMYIGLPFSGARLDVQAGNLLHLHGRLASDSRKFAARVSFGSDSTKPLPQAGFAVGGHVEALDLSGWMQLIADKAGGSGSSLDGVDLQADSMLAWARDFGPAHFVLKPAPDSLEMDFDGAQVVGNVHMPLTDLHQRGVTAQFKRLYWPEAPESVNSKVAEENPTALPPLHIRIDDFHLGHSSFGTASVESYPIADGAHFEQVSTHSRNVEMRAHGDWTGTPGQDTSRFSIDFSAHNLGRMLDAFGYAGVVDDGQTVAQIHGSWAGSPSTFALARLDGTLKVSVREGRIPDADPGAGRIFGLFNLNAIPRRLSLDFSDFFKSGFSFDSIEGLFTLKDGDAYTHNLKILGPAAEIDVSGRTGLKAKDYDQIMQVTPHVGGTLAVGGALVGGPVGAAAGALLQGILKKPLNAATRNRYSVTGSWENPKITLLKKEPVPQPKPSGSPKNKPAADKQTPASGSKQQS